MSLSDQIQTDMVSAMRNQQAIRLGTLRMVKTALKNKQVETRQELSDETVIGVLHTLVKQRRDSAAQFRKGGREDMADKEEEEISVIETYLPAPASGDEIAAAIVAAIEETEASGPKDMGRVMKATMERLAGKTVDGGSISRMVKERLTG
jgi:uncharacterized protein YqeY